MQEPHLAKIKHQGESKLQQPAGSFSTPHYTEKTGELPPTEDASTKPTWEIFGIPNR
jgi:hypothetical protein